MLRPQNIGQVSVLSDSAVPLSALSLPSPVANCRSGESRKSKVESRKLLLDASTRRRAARSRAAKPRARDRALRRAPAHPCTRPILLTRSAQPIAVQQIPITPDVAAKHLTLLTLPRFLQLSRFLFQLSRLHRLQFPLLFIPLLFHFSFSSLFTFSFSYLLSSSPLFCPSSFSFSYFLPSFPSSSLSLNTN